MLRLYFIKSYLPDVQHDDKIQTECITQQDQSEAADFVYGAATMAKLTKHTLYL